MPIDYSKVNFDDALPETVPTGRSLSEDMHRVAVPRDPHFLAAVAPSQTQEQLSQIERKLNAIMDHLGIPR